jgi:hypothetical protein
MDVRHKEATMKATLVTGLVVGLAGGCVVMQEEVAAGVGESVATAGKEAPVIVGNVDWVESGSLPQEDPRRVAGLPVALLWLPSVGSRCTGFLVTEDVLMTNHHCVSSAEGARGAYAVFDAERGVPDTLREAVDCSTFLGADAALDFGLLRCEGTPGARHGVVTVSDSMPAREDAIFVVHQNCDYYTQPACQPDKKVSPGRVKEISSTELTHDADTLGGSSGSALFNALGHVVGLHHVGLGGNGSGRGTANRSVRMDKVLAKLRSTHADLAAALTLPGATPGPAPDPRPPAAGDTYEPNDRTSQATDITLPFRADALELTPTDRDMFKVVLTSPRALHVRMVFSHAVGDLDLYLYRDGDSSPMARSEGVTDAEDIVTDVDAGTYYALAVPYNGAHGTYALTVE